MKKNSMVNSAEFRVAYEKFYVEMREYLWDLVTLELLADIEVITYQSFIDVADLEKKLSRLYQSIREVAKEDEYLQEAYDRFYQLVEDNKESQMYFSLYQVEEV